MFDCAVDAKLVRITDELDDMAGGPASVITGDLYVQAQARIDVVKVTDLPEAWELDQEG